MKFRHLELYRVGRYNGAALQDLNDGLTVVYGENEAGKSTLLSSIRGLLFGKIPLADVVVATEPGAFGKLVFETEGGERVALERTLHRKSPPKVTFADGTERHGVDSLHAAAPELSHVEELLYNSVFTLQLRDLREFSATTRSVQDKLYSVGMMGSVSPLVLEAELLTAAKTIFNPHKGARNPRLVQCLLELREVEAQLRQENDSPEAFRSLERSKAKLQGHVEELRTACAEEQRKLWRLRRLKDMFPDYQELRALDAQEEILNTGLGQPRTLETNLGQDAVDERVLNTLDELSSLLSTHQDLSERRLESAARVETLESQMKDVINRLSDVWTVSDMQRVDLRAQRMVELRVLARNLDTETSLQRQSTDRWTEAMRDRTEAEEALTAKFGTQIAAAAVRLNDWVEKQQELEAQLLRDETRIQLWSKVDDQRRQLATLQLPLKARVNPLAKEFTRFGLGVAMTGAGTVLLLVFALGSAWFQQWLAVGAAVLASSLLAFLWILQKRWYGRVHGVMREAAERDNSTDVEAQMSKLQAEQDRIVRDFERVHPQGAEVGTLVGLQTALHRAKREVLTLGQKILSAERLLEQWRERVAIETKFAQQMDEVTKHLAQSRAAWLAAVEHLFGKPTEINPEVLFHDLVRVENWRQLKENHTEETKRMKSTTSQLQTVQVEVLERVQAFAQSTFATENPHDTALIIDCPRHPEIYISSLVAYRANVDTVLRTLREKLNERRERQMSEHKKRLQHEQTRAMVWGRLKAKSATDEQFLDDISVLDTIQPEELNAKIETAEHHAKHAATVLEDTTKELWRIEETMRNMEGYQRTEELMWRQAQLQSERRTLAFQWGSMAIAKSLVTGARLRYEQTQQAPAIQEASCWLSDITGGRYVALMARAEAVANGSEAKAGLYARDQQGKWWDMAQLSRGTQELVYFALRLGLVRTYALRNIVLPMVLDDPMVNLDDLRTRKFFEILANVAQGHQMIYFTCHRKIADMAENHGQTHLLTLEGVK